MIHQLDDEEMTFKTHLADSGQQETNSHELQVVVPVGTAEGDREAEFDSAQIEQLQVWYFVLLSSVCSCSAIATC